MAAVAGERAPSPSRVLARLSSDTRRRLGSELSLPFLHLLLHRLHQLRIWQPSEEPSERELRALSESTKEPSLVVPVRLPNGKSTAVTHHNTQLEEIFEKVCAKLRVDPKEFRMVRNEKGELRMMLREEYEVERKSDRLGLTIFAHSGTSTDNHRIRAEVRAVQETSLGVGVGDVVLAVDGLLVEEMKNAAEVEKRLKEGRILTLLRRPPQDEEVDETKETSKEKKPSRDAASNAKNLSKLVHVLGELLSTERKFVADIGDMIERFLRNAAVEEVMESARRLLRTQTRFLSELEEAIGDLETTTPVLQVKDALIRVSALFVNRCSSFKIYSEYSAAYLRLQQMVQERKDVARFLAEANASGEQRTSYESIMIRPVQRLVQYPLFLSQILAQCETASLEWRQTKDALAHMESLADYVNEMLRVHQVFASSIESLAKSEAKLLRAKNCSVDIRQLLLFSHVQWLNAPSAADSDGVIFVFSTVILLLGRHSTTRKGGGGRSERVLPLSEVEVNEVPVEESLFVLIHVGVAEDAVFQLAVCQPAIKTQLIKAIRKASQSLARAEARRPLSGSSQSDGGYGSETQRDKSSL